MNIEDTLLSLLKPGEMLRFAMTRTGEGIHYSLEGAGAEGDPDACMRRLESCLSLARESGYSFACPAALSQSTSGRKGGSTGDNVDETEEWSEVRPLKRLMSTVSEGRVGFSGDEATGDGKAVAAIWMPAFALPLPRGLFSRALSSLEGISRFKALELDFEAVVLPADWAATLARLRPRAEEWSWALPPGAEGLADGGGIGLARKYLDLWLWHRTGWKVTFRVLGTTSASRASLELAGRGLFGTECEIVDSLADPLDRHGALSMNDWFPSGWPAPEFFPRGERGQSGGPSRLYNASPPRLPRTGVPIGSAEGAAVCLPWSSRDAHTYIAGATGTGKSSLLLRLIVEDMKRGEAVIVLDPHGDLCREVLALVPQERADHVMLIDPLSAKVPSYNVLEIARDRFHRRSVDLLASGLMGFFMDVWDGVDAFGPVFETYYQNTLLLLTLQKEHHVTLADFSRVLTNDEFRQGLIDACEDELVRRFWTDTAARAGGDISLRNVAPYISTKVDPLVQGSVLGKMLGGKRDELALGERMDKKGIILFNLDKGALGFRQSQLLGTLVAVQIFAAGLARAARPASRRPPVNLYIDEFQNFVSGNLASMLSEARKFGLRLTLANQTLGQLEGGRRSNVIDSVLGNVANQIFFRLGVADSRRLADFTFPLSSREMQFLPNHHALGRFLDEGCPLPPFVFRTLAPPCPPKKKRRRLEIF